MAESFCARCHQSGKLDKAIPAGGFANVLDLHDVAEQSSLVVPGVADASRFYDVLLTRHAPLDLSRTGGEPTPDDLQAVREWINDLPPRTNRCAGRDPIRSADVETWIDEALRVEREQAQDVRFISLVPLYNACAGSDVIAAARQAVTKLLNSLSWSTQPRKLNAVDPNGTLLSFKLSDFGWVGAHWEAIDRAYPKALATPLPERTRSLAGAANVVVRGDWLADAVSDPKLYYKLLGIPQKLGELAKMNGLDIEHDVRIARARRAVIRNSTVTRGNRLAERHPGARGAFWMAYDFATSTGDQDLFEHPLGPKASSSVKTPFKPDSIRTMFALPNGLLAFALFDASGNRIDQVLPGVDKPLYPGVSETNIAGRGCFACHQDGIKPLRDEFRPQAMTDTGPGKDTREQALQLAATDAELLLLREGDNERYHNALTQAGVDPALTFAGQEIISGLARRYRAGTDYAGAASELGLDAATFETALAGANGATAILARRLHYHALPRDQIDQLFGYLKGVELAPGMAPAVPPPGNRIGLDMWLDKPRPQAGDLLAVNVQSDADCYLTVINVDAAGKAAVLFPNDFEPNNLINAGKVVRVPGADAPYQLRRKEDGRELLIAQCSTSPAPPTGIEHEFDRQRFTMLGNWENFVQDGLITDADLRRSPEKAERARVARAQAIRRQRGNAPAEQRDTSPDKPLVDGRAVVVLDKQP